MTFSNQNILPAELPTIEEVRFHPLEKKYLLVERISFAIALAIVLAVAIPLFYFIEFLQKPTILFIALALLCLLSLIAWFSTGIDFSYSGYALREKDLLFRSGWFIRKKKVVLLNRVQHVSIQSGPIERQFGLASISIFTAGASQADFTIKGIKEETARNLKEWVSNQLNGDINQ